MSPTHAAEKSLADQPIRMLRAATVTFNHGGRKARIAVVGRSSIPLELLQEEFPGADILSQEVAGQGAMVFPEPDVSSGDEPFDLSVLSNTSNPSQETKRTTAELSSTSSPAEAMAYLSHYTTAVRLVIVELCTPQTKADLPSIGSSATFFEYADGPSDSYTQLIASFTTGNKAKDLRTSGYLHQELIEDGDTENLPWYLQVTRVPLNNLSSIETTVLTMSAMKAISKTHEASKLAGLREKDVIRNTREGHVGQYIGRYGEEIVYSHNGNLYQAKAEDIAVGLE